jgi:NitT/TauT family transport system substrate-binding protein
MIKATRAHGFIGLCCAALLAALAGCKQQKPEQPAAPAAPGTTPAAAAQPAPTLTPTKLVLDWVPEPEFGGFYAAREEGLYSKQGLQVEILSGGAGVPVVQMVATSQADFGTASADQVLTARVRGVDVIPLMAVYQNAPMAIMAHASRGAKSLKDVLASGTLAVEPGLAYVTFIKKKYGFDKVKVVPYDGGVARFAADKDFAQQCFLTSEPLAAKRQGADPVVFRVADEGFNPYTTVVFTRGELWRKSPERVRAFLQASREGWQSYLKDPKPANAVMSKLNTSMTPETFAEVAEVQRSLIETEETRARGLGTMSRERWETLGQQLVELGLIEKAPAVDEYLVAEFLGASAAASPE